MRALTLERPLPIAKIREFDQVDRSSINTATARLPRPSIVTRLERIAPAAPRPR